MTQTTVKQVAPASP